MEEAAAAAAPLAGGAPPRSSTGTTSRKSLFHLAGALNVDAEDLDELDLYVLDDAHCEGPSLPPTIYSAALISPFGTRRHLTTTCGGFFLNAVLVLPNWLLLFVNFGIQAAFVYFVGEIGGPDTYCPVNPILRSAGLLVFLIYNVGEIVETLTLFHWLALMPTAKKVRPIAFGEDADGFSIVVSGIPAWYKVLSGALVLLPKLAIGVALCFLGAGFLLHSPDEGSLIINSVGLFFVTQIDELFFVAFTPGVVAQGVERLPSMRVRGCAIIFYHIARPWVLLGLTLALAYTFSTTLCDAAD